MTRIRIVASAVLLVLATSLAAPLGVSAQSAPIKIGLVNSMYQSQKVPQMNW